MGREGDVEELRRGRPFVLSWEEPLVPMAGSSSSCPWRGPPAAWHHWGCNSAGRLATQGQAAAPAGGGLCGCPSPQPLCPAAPRALIFTADLLTEAGEAEALSQSRVRPGVLHEQALGSANRLPPARRCSGERISLNAEKAAGDGGVALKFNSRRGRGARGLGPTSLINLGQKNVSDRENTKMAPEQPAGTWEPGDGGRSQLE